MDKRNAAFAKRLHVALERCRLLDKSDGDLATLLVRHRVVVSPQTVGNWRRGRHLPKLDQFVGLAGMLRMEPGELAFGRLGVAVAEQREGDAAFAEEDAVVQAYALLDERRRALVRELIGLLSAPGLDAKRPGRRKTAPAKAR